MKKKLENSRIVDELPKNFEGVKREYQKAMNIFLAHNKEVVETSDIQWKSDVCDVTTEGYALSWILLQELYKFFNLKEGELVERIMERMENENTNKIYLPKFGLKLVYDKEARWLESHELSTTDWLEIDKKDNAKFLNKRN